MSFFVTWQKLFLFELSGKFLNLSEKWSGIAFIFGFDIINIQDKKKQVKVDLRIYPAMNDIDEFKKLFL